MVKENFGDRTIVHIFEPEDIKTVSNGILFTQKTWGKSEESFLIRKGNLGDN